MVASQHYALRLFLVAHANVQRSIRTHVAEINGGVPKRHHGSEVAKRLANQNRERRMHAELPG